MDKQRILHEINAIYINCRDYMKNIPEDWQKVYDALHRVYDKYNHDDWVLEKVVQAYCDLEDYWGGKENVCRS